MHHKTKNSYVFSKHENYSMVIPGALNGNSDLIDIIPYEKIYIILYTVSTFITYKESLQIQKCKKYYNILENNNSVILTFKSTYCLTHAS
jgi:hypothetical protein